MIDEAEQDEKFEGPEPKASGAILGALTRAERVFNDWQATCQTIDEVYSLGLGYYVSADIDSVGPGWGDRDFDLFWSSYEILKPAVYAKPPVPAVAPLFQDNRPLQTTTAEVLERTSITALKATCIDDVMTGVRDDLLFTNRGVIWVRYDTDDGQSVCYEHLDRTDFLHEPARKWSEVGWVARRAWMTKKEMRTRFFKTSGNAYQNASYRTQRERQSGDDSQSLTRKAGVWEVWHKGENKTFWVTEGVAVLLDSDTPEVKLSGFFPCPRPAYGTLQRRSLIPVPDYRRYASQFNKIGQLTARIHTLLDTVRMKGLIPAGGDVGDAVEQLIASDDDQMLVPVPGAAMMGGADRFVAWLPLAEVATAITGLIEARQQLINDFYELSGISDIMRGATQAEETLGAQQLKSQYGSVRVRGKIDELQRVAAEAVKIGAEIIAEKFSQKTILEMCQMDLHTKADIDKRIKGIEKAAEQELTALEKKAREALQRQQEQPDADAAQQQLQQAQQQIIQKYAPMLQEAQQQVPIEDVMKLLRDDRVRSFTFEIETDSTILTDEMQEKASRNEFLTEFTNASQGLTGLMSMGEEGAGLAGEMLKFVLAPYRAGRQLSGAIDKFIDAAPRIAAQAAAANGGDEGLAEASNKLAEAEQIKAQAAMASVQSKSELAQAENARKMAELQLKAQTEAQKAQEARAKLELQLAEATEKARLASEKQQAEIDNLTAQTAKILASIGLDERKQQLSEYSAASNEQARRVDQSMAMEGQQTDVAFREREHERAERGEQRADRQQDLTEQQTHREVEQ